MKSKVITLIIISLISFFLTEVVLRIYSNFNYVMFASDYGIPCIERVDNKLYYTLKKNCDRSVKYNYMQKRVSFKTNSCRMRDDEEYCSKSKNSLSKKILFFGDSYTQNPYLDNKYNFSKLLEKKINKKNSKYVVLNYGVSGYSLEQNVDKIRQVKEINKIQNEDYVVFQFLLNDIYDVRDNPPKKIKKYLNYSYSFRVLNYLRRKIIYKNNYFDLQKMIKKDYTNIKYEKLLKNKFCEINSIFKNQNTNIIFLYLPYMEVSNNWKNYNVHNLEKNVIKIAKDCGFKNFISLTKELSKFDYDELIISQNFNHHLNKNSNNIIAEKIYEFIKFN